MCFEGYLQKVRNLFQYGVVNDESTNNTRLKIHVFAIGAAEFILCIILPIYFVLLDPFMFDTDIKGDVNARQVYVLFSTIVYCSGIIFSILLTLVYHDPKKLGIWININIVLFIMKFIIYLMDATLLANDVIGALRVFVEFLYVVVSWYFIYAASQFVDQLEMERLRLRTDPVPGLPTNTVPRNHVKSQLDETPPPAYETLDFV